MTEDLERIAEEVEEHLLGRGLRLQLLDEWGKVIASQCVRDDDVIFKNLPVGTVISAMRIMFNGSLLHATGGDQFPKIHILDEATQVCCQNPTGYVNEMLKLRTDGNGNVILQSASDGGINISWDQDANKVFKL